MGGGEGEVTNEKQATAGELQACIGAPAGMGGEGREGRGGRGGRGGKGTKAEAAQALEPHQGRRRRNYLYILRREKERGVAGARRRV